MKRPNVTALPSLSREVTIPRRISFGYALVVLMMIVIGITVIVGVTWLSSSNDANEQAVLADLDRSAGVLIAIVSALTAVGVILGVLLAWATSRRLSAIRPYAQNLRDRQLPLTC